MGVNIRDASTSQARSFVRRFSVPYPSFYSPDGRALLAFRGTLTPNSIPSFVVLDAEGRVAASIIGAAALHHHAGRLVGEVVGGGSGRGGSRDG